MYKVELLIGLGNKFKKWLVTPFLGIGLAAKAAIVPVFPLFLVAVAIIAAGEGFRILYKYSRTDSTSQKTQVKPNPPTLSTPKISPIGNNGYVPTVTVTSSILAINSSIHPSGASPNGEGKDCQYTKQPETSARYGDRKLENYPYLMNSLIIKQINSTDNKPILNIEKWSRDAGITFTLVPASQPLMGSYTVQFDTPRTATQLSVIINQMFKADAPGLPGTATAFPLYNRCKYEYIEPNWAITPQENITQRLPLITDPLYPKSVSDKGWDWLGGRYTKNKQSYTSSSQYGSNFIDAWFNIDNWVKNKGGIPNVLNPTYIAVVDDMMLNKNESPELHDVYFEKYYTVGMNLTPQESVGDCSYRIQLSCHGELVSSVLAAKTGTDSEGKVKGNPGALGIGLNYGEHNVFKIFAFQLDAGQRTFDDDKYKDSADGKVLRDPNLPFGSVYYRGNSLTPKMILKRENYGVNGPNGPNGKIGMYTSTALNNALTQIVYGYTNPYSASTDLSKTLSAVRVINVSLGGEGPCSIQTKLLLEKIKSESKDKIIIVAAVANYDPDNAGRGPIAACPNVIPVVSHDFAGDLADQTSRGIDFSTPGAMSLPISAPGVAIPLLGRADRPIDNVVSGTSFAAPQVTAAIAIMLSIDPNLTTKDVYFKLLDSATALPGANYFGRHLLNTGKAVEQLILAKHR